MNRPLDISCAPLSVDLAREPEFFVGALRVRPSERQIMAHDMQETIQPRVMQVLVALARARGAVLSREQLIESCWRGIIVGDDAINRCIAKVRQIADFGGGPYFVIETIPRVGYRLKPTTPQDTQETTLAAPRELAGHTVEIPGLKLNAWPRRRTVIVIAAIISATLAAVLGSAMLRSAFSDTTVAVVSRRRPTPDLGVGLVTDLARLTSARSRLAFIDGSEGAHPDFVLKIDAYQTGRGIRADAVLIRREATDVLWAFSSTSSSTDTATAWRQIANVVARVIGCAAQTSGDLRHSDPKRLHLLFAACEVLDDQFESPDASKVELWRKVVDAYPNDAAAPATLALLEAQRAGLDNGQSPALAAAAQIHIADSRSLDGRVGTSYAAEADLLPPWRYQDRLAVLDRGLALDPDCPALHRMKSEVMSDVGGMEEAVASARRAVELEPSSPELHGNLITALFFAGYTEIGTAELDSAEHIWPDSFAIRSSRWSFDLRFGDPNKLTHMIDNGNWAPNASVVAQHSVFSRFLLARAKPTPGNIKTAVDSAVARARRGLPPQTVLQNIVALGQVDEAYKLLADPQILAGFRRGRTDILFRVNMRAFRLDRRFMALADKLGLVQFWQSSGHWPDFCDDKDLPYSCQLEARRLRPSALKP